MKVNWRSFVSFFAAVIGEQTIFYANGVHILFNLFSTAVLALVWQAVWPVLED